MKSAYLKYVLALLLFGSNGVVASHISLTSYEIVLLRTGIGSALLVLLFCLRGGKFTFFRQKKENCFLALSGMAMGVSWMFLYEAYQRIGVSLSSLLYYCGPVIVMALSPLLFREKLTAAKIVSFLVVAMGVVAVNGGVEGGIQDHWGLFCGAMSALMYAAMVICSKKTVHITGMENSALQLLVSFLTAAVFMGLRQGLSLAVPAGNWPWILLLGLMNTGFGCYCYFSSIGSLPVQTVAICGYLEPLSAVVFSVVLLHETMMPLQALGAAAVVGGAILGTLSPQKKE